MFGGQNDQFHVLRTYRRAARGKRKAEVNSEAWSLHFQKALCDEMRGIAKSMSKVPVKASQNSVWHVPDPFKIEAQGAPGNRNATLKLFRAATRQPRAPQKCTRAAQEGPKSGQEPPRSAQVPAN